MARFCGCMSGVDTPIPIAGGLIATAYFFSAASSTF
jgi:hypothetical protein